MTIGDRAAARWPFIRAQLPAPPALVIDLGCGPEGGFVPLLAGEGFEATGVDPEAPEGPGYRQLEFEHYQPRRRVHAVIASSSLHHVSDLSQVLDLVAAVLVPQGVLVVAEWDWERFDETTARWCFDRLGPAGDEPGWLHERRQEWIESGLPWDVYRRRWAQQENCHTGADMLRELDARFECRICERAPYFCSDLPGTTEAAEQAAIAADLIRANGIRYVGTART